MAKSASPFTIRKTFEALLGRQVMAYVLHLRPLEWPIMTAHFFLGALLAVGFDLPWGNTILGWFIFVVLMNGGTLAINSAFDQDEGDIGYLKSPPKPPKHLLPVSALMLTGAYLLGYLLPPVFAWATAACVLMSVLYSVPPARLKARAGWDLIINMLGFGLLTPMAGWGLTNKPLEPWFWKICIGFAFLFGALYPATQIYQVEEDTARGDKTFVIRLGTAKSLIAAMIMQLAAHAMFVWAAFEQNLPPLSESAIILISCVLWNTAFSNWRIRWRSLSQKEHEKMMYWLLACWAVTDVVLLCVFWPR
ncbi:MAG: prenyltransferase [Holophagales bacterium]|jgi:4-hydroxybenzoate polyprenyltransferase|nr:prenyltransferase [Holophagales bacterium]